MFTPERMIKGRIAETVFEQMFLATKKYTILKGGYEHTMPLVAQISHSVIDKQVLEGIRKSPDFVLIANDHRHVDLVEVKYRTHWNLAEIVKTAKGIHTFWPHTQLFIVSKTGFWMDTCEDIIKKNFINKLSPEVVSTELQEKYLATLAKFLD